MKAKLFVLLLVAVLLAGCATEATIASQNVSTGADQFQIIRRIVFVNGITDEYLLEVQGLCSINADMADNQLEVTCKVGDGRYLKHYFGLSDNSLYFVEQMDVANVSGYHYKVMFRPAVIAPDIDVDLP